MTVLLYYYIEQRFLFLLVSTLKCAISYYKIVISVQVGSCFQGTADVLHSTRAVLQS